jgi:V/A-type H+-transporting ATPase subunit E
MDNRLQELTDKIYQEGVNKGKEEADKILESAKSEAEEIVKKAKNESSEIIENAKKEAAEIRKTTESELKLSSDQTVNALKQEIVDLVSRKSIDEEASNATADDDFMEKVILEMVKNWKADADVSDLKVLISEQNEKILSSGISKDIKKLMDDGLEIETSKGVKTGFVIGPKDDSYKISFTDEDFSAFFKDYLRPRLIEMLFEK